MLTLREEPPLTDVVNHFLRTNWHAIFALVSKNQGMTDHPHTKEPLPMDQELPPSPVTG